METRRIIAICRRHGIPEKYIADFRKLMQLDRIDNRKFGRLVRRNHVFKTCLEEMLDLLSEPWSYLFEPSQFESLEPVT